MKLFCRGWLTLLAPSLIFTTLATAADNIGSARELGEYLTHHGYGAASLVSSESGKPFLKVQINGTDALMALDSTVPAMLTIHRANVCRLSIRDSGRKLWDLNGLSLKDLGIVSVDAFTVNGYEINRTKSVPVLPSPRNLEWGDGIFGYDFLHSNAAIVPTGSKLIFFKPGTNPAVNIDSRMRAMGLKPVPMAYGESGMKIQGQLNGQPFTALVASGQRYSLFDVGYLNKIHQAWDKTYQQFFYDEGERVAFYQFNPSSLQLGEIVIQPARFAACNSPWFAHLDCSAIIGNDILSSRGAVLDFGSDTIWMR